MFWLLILAQTAPTEETNNSPSAFKPYILLLGILIIAYFLLRNTRRKIARNQQRNNLSARERIAQTTRKTQVRDQISELMAELAELSRQINGQLDTRMAKLEILLQEADKMIKNLQYLTKNGKKSPFPNKSDSVAGLAEQFFKSHNTSETNSAAATNSIEENEETREILSLAEKGDSPVNIAQKLHRPVGEIELILALQGKKPTKK